MVVIRPVEKTDFFRTLEVPVDELEVLALPVRRSSRRRRSPYDIVSGIAPGTRVRMRIPATSVEAVVVEDRGRIGPDGRLMVRIETIDKPVYLDEYEVPVDELEQVSPPWCSCEEM